MSGLVSVVMNCYNSDRFLLEAIESVLSQTYQNFEIIFWDNQSEDDSASIVRSFNDPRIKYFLAPKHTTLGEARFLATERASGEFIAFLDCDDEWVPHKLDVQVSAMSNSKYGFCYAGIVRRDHKGQFLQNWVPEAKSGYIFSDLINYFNVDMLTPVIRSSVMKTLNITFNPKMVACEEVNLFLRLSLHCEAVVLDQVLGMSRRLPNSLTKTASGKIYIDLQATTEQLISENSIIETQFPREIEHLRFKTLYHQCRWLMEENEHKKAKELMESSSFDASLFKILRFLVKSTTAWNIAHNVTDRLPYLKRFSLRVIFEAIGAKPKNG